MAMPFRKKYPIWLARQREDDPELAPAYRRSVRYFRKLYQAWPDWCGDHPDFRAVYEEAERRRARGEDVQVDHVVPLCSDIVCGLHVPWNLEVIPRVENIRKGNREWPGCPFEQLPLNLEA